MFAGRRGCRRPGPGPSYARGHPLRREWRGVRRRFRRLPDHAGRPHGNRKPPDSRLHTPTRRRRTEARSPPRAMATGLGGRHPQDVDNLRPHLLVPAGRRSGGRVHRRIPRTAGLSAVCTAIRTPSSPWCTRRRLHTPNPQPVDNFCAQPGYNRPTHRPPFFPRLSPTWATGYPRSGKAGDQGKGPSPATVVHTPFTACGRTPSTTTPTGGQRCPPTIPRRVPSLPLFEHEAVRRAGSPPGRRGAGDRRHGPARSPRGRRGPRR